MTLLGTLVVDALWQGALVAALLALVLPLLRSPESRYAASVAALAAMVVAPLMGLFGVAPAGAGQAPTWLDLLGRAWLVGASLFGLRILGSHLQLLSLKRQAIAPPPELQRRFEALRSRIDASPRVRLLLSPRVAVPLAAGILRPVVLLPPALLLQLAPDELDALIAHELAHLRRLDPLVNALQVVAEALLFFHPAAWWVSACVRREREFACDRLAARCTDTVACARALAALAEGRLPLLATAATGGPLMDRIHALLDLPRPRRLSPSLAAVLALMLVPAAWAGGQPAEPEGVEGAPVEAAAELPAPQGPQVPPARIDRGELRQARAETREGRLRLAQVNQDLDGRVGEVAKLRDELARQQRELELLRQELSAQTARHTKPAPHPRPAPHPKRARRSRMGRTTALAQAPAVPGMPPVPPVGLTMPTPPIPTPPGEASFTQVFHSVDGERVVVQQHLVGDRDAVKAQVEQLLKDLDD